MGKRFRVLVNCIIHDYDTIEQAKASFENYKKTNYGDSLHGLLRKEIAHIFLIDRKNNIMLDAFEKVV